MVKLLLIVLAIGSFCTHAVSAFTLERRKPQFLTEPIYLILPMPYSLPGIGSGLMFTGLAANVMDTYIDLYGLAITGDAKGVMLGAEDFHLISETLFIDLQYQDLNSAVVQNYEERGMDSKQDEYQLIELSKVFNKRAKITLSLFDRRFELYARQQIQEIEITKIRNAEGDLIADFSQPYKETSEENSYGLVLDFTDDRQDPRKGLRLESVKIESPPQEDFNPDYYVVSHSLSAYIPIGKASTWAFNYFISDAIVAKEGNTDYERVKADVGLNCDLSDNVCLETEEQLIQRFIAGRKYGTAESLGGDEKLRAYPQGRYQAAHTLYYATELRINFAEDVTPFDFLIWKDVATGFQLALFYEAGGVADLKEDLGDTIKTSQGFGIRMISASGFVYRADLAWGDEGNTTTIIFGYPW